MLSFWHPQLSWAGAIHLWGHFIGILQTSVGRRIVHFTTLSAKLLDLFSQSYTGQTINKTSTCHPTRPWWAVNYDHLPLFGTRLSYWHTLLCCLCFIFIHPFFSLLLSYVWIQGQGLAFRLEKAEASFSDDDMQEYCSFHECIIACC